MAKERVRDQYEQERFDKGKELMRSLSNMVNVMGDRHSFDDGFLEELSKTHPTLQQSVGRLMVKMINHWAELQKKGWTDGRNEALGKLCIELKKHTDDHHLPFI